MTFSACMHVDITCQKTSLCHTVRRMQALASNNLEKVASTMEQFERQFENLDVQSQFVESAMNNQASLSTPEEDVNLLMQQVCTLLDCHAVQALQQISVRD